MIVRVFHAQIQADKVALWQEKVENFSIPWLEEQRGMLGYYPGKPLSPASTEYSMISLWQDVAALQEAVGEDYGQVVLLEDEAALVEETWLEHYELFGGTEK